MKAAVIWKQRFLRKRLKYMLICVFVVGIVFVVHQLFYFKELNRAVVGELVSGPPPRGTRRFITGKPVAKWNDPFYMKRLRDKDGRVVSLHGTRDEDVSKYLPNSHGKFVCFTTKEEIDFIKVNDDYCDCPLDGSDEPGTSACNNGVFFCEASSSKSPAKIPSYKVNDGYCDCCDGSDEWSETTVAHRLLGEITNRSTKCQDKC